MEEFSSQSRRAKWLYFVIFMAKLPLWLYMFTYHCRHPLLPSAGPFYKVGVWHIDAGCWKAVENKHSVLYKQQNGPNGLKTLAMSNWIRKNKGVFKRHVTSLETLLFIMANVKFHLRTPIMITYLCNEHPLTPQFYIQNLGFTQVYIFFHIFCS